MSAPALLSELRRRDIQVRAEGGELRCSAPAGALTAELREALRRHKSDLIALLASAQAIAATRALVPLQPEGGEVPLFGVPGHNGDVFCYRILSQSLGSSQPFFGLQPPGADGAAEPLERVEDLAGYFAEQIRALRPGAACMIAGFCAGGAVAFELARTLLQSGVPVPLLALFGCPYPAHFLRRTQLALGLAQLRRRVAGHARALAGRSWREARRYVAAELRERRERTAAERSAALDPVLRRRAQVERSTLRAVRRYKMQAFPGRIALFLPGREWRDSGVAALRWREVAKDVQVYYGPEESTGADMLREQHAAAFARLFAQARKENR